MADPAAPRIAAVGDAALLVTLGDELDLATNAFARRVAADVEARRPTMPGLGRPVPAHASVLVPFDPDELPEAAVRELLGRALDRSASNTAEPGIERPAVELTVAYGGADGPDLAEVAERTGLAEAEVVRLHTSVEYRVLAIGFVPGFPYLGVLPGALELPRRSTPRIRVPAGSVAIAGRQTAVYPFETPGGWHLIGRTEARLWDAGAGPPARLAPGDRVRFVPA
jgi:KipI family sensor histidine kinase inhibitor